MTTKFVDDLLNPFKSRSVEGMSRPFDVPNALIWDNGIGFHKIEKFE